MYGIAQKWSRKYQERVSLLFVVGTTLARLQLSPLRELRGDLHVLFSIRFVTRSFFPRSLYASDPYYNPATSLFSKSLLANTAIRAFP